VGKLDPGLKLLLETNRGALSGMTDSSIFAGRRYRSLPQVRRVEVSRVLERGTQSMAKLLEPGTHP
jgi:hypothetical protein